MNLPEIPSLSFFTTMNAEFKRLHGGGKLTIPAQAKKSRRLSLLKSATLHTQFHTD